MTTYLVSLPINTCFSSSARSRARQEASVARGAPAALSRCFVLPVHGATSVDAGVLGVLDAVSGARFPVARVFLLDVGTRCAWLAAFWVVVTESYGDGARGCAGDAVALWLLQAQIASGNLLVVEVACGTVRHEIAHN